MVKNFFRRCPLSKYKLAVLFVLACLLTGCADFDAPRPMQIIKTPIGPDAAKIGMSKSEVLSLYGDPDAKRAVIADKWSGEREEWFYKARIAGLPVNADYLADDLYLYFDGNSLTTISRRPLGGAKGAKIYAEENIK